MHRLGATPNAGKYLELSIDGDDDYPWQRDLLVGEPLAVSAGHVTIPNAPGWGVEISPRGLDKAQHQESAQERCKLSSRGALDHQKSKA